MDGVDKKILAVLREEARTPVAEIARRVGVTRTTVHERLKRLTESGVILGTTVRLDPRAMGYPLRAFILVQWSAQQMVHQREVASKIAEIPGVAQVHNVTGQQDFLVEVVARDMDQVGRLIIDRLRRLPGVGTTETLLSFWSFEGVGVPLEEPARAPRD